MDQDTQGRKGSGLGRFIAGLWAFLGSPFTRRLGAEELEEDLEEMTKPAGEPKHALPHAEISEQERQRAAEEYRREAWHD